MTTIGTKPLVIQDGFYIKGTVNATAGTTVERGTLLYFDPADSKFKPYTTGTHKIVGVTAREFVSATGGDNNENILTAGLIDETQLTFASGVTLDSLTDGAETVRMQLQRMGVFCVKTHDLTV